MRDLDAVEIEDDIKVIYLDISSCTGEVFYLHREVKIETTFKAFNIKISWN